MSGRSLAWAAAVGLLLGAWLAAPWHASAARRALRIAVFDRSASVERTRPDLAAWMVTAFEREATLAREADSDFAALVFAGDRAWWRTPGRPAGPSGAPPRLGDTLASDLAGALELAREGATRAGAGGGLVRVFSDARASGVLPEGALRALAAAGWSVEQGDLPSPALDDVGIESLRAPERVEEGAPLACELRVRASLHPGSAQPRTVKVELQVTGAEEPGAVSFERSLDAEGREATWRFDLGPAPAGGARIAARVELAGDPIPENDRAARWVESGGALAIAVVAPADGGDGEAAAGAFVSGGGRWPGLAFLRVTPAELPRVLSHVRAVITLDQDRESLPLAALEGFLESGGGWLDAAGSAALRARDDSESAGRARRILALWPDEPPRPARDVLLLIDGSGSMAGSTFDAVRASALRLAEVVPARDRLLLAFFHRELEPPIVLRDAGDARAATVDLAALLALRAPGGGTDVLGVLEDLARSRAADAPAMLALLSSDGRDPAAERAGDPGGLRGRLAAARIELQVFAFGPDPDLGFLASLLPPGRPLAQAQDGRSLAALFERAVDAERLVLDAAVVVGSAEGFPQPSLARDLAEALAAGAPRTLGRAWRARAHSEAQVLWRSAEGEPLLAVLPIGRGAAAALASLPARGWAPSAAEESALGPLLRGLARGGRERALLPSAELEAGRLWVRGLPAEAPAELIARFPGGGEVFLAPPVGAGDEPRTTRVGRMPLGGLAGTLDLRSPAGEHFGSVALEHGISAEFAAPPVPIAAHGLAGDSAPRRRLPHPAAPWVLAGSLAALGLALLLGLQAR